MITLNEKKCMGLRKGEIESIRKSVDYVNRVLGSKEFEIACMTFAFKETGGKTNAAICAEMRSNHEIAVSMYYKWWSKVVGWTSLGDSGSGVALIHANRKFWDLSEPLNNGSNILHEYCHFLNYTHSVKPWFFSVPYGSNYIYAQVSRQLGLK